MCLLNTPKMKNACIRTLVLRDFRRDMLFTRDLNFMYELSKEIHTQSSRQVLKKLVDNVVDRQNGRNYN